MKYKQKYKWIVLTSIVFTLFLLFGFSFIGVYAANDDNNSNMISSLTPALALDIRDSAVTVETATDGQITADYNSDIYNVVIDTGTDTWKVNVSSKLQSNTNDDPIILYLPDVEYSDISMNITSAYFACSSIKAGNIIGNYKTAAVYLTLPTNYVGSLDAAVTSGYFQLISKDDFGNTNTSIIDDGEFGEVYVPKNFTKEGNVFTYTNGTEQNVIKVARRGMGVIGIYSSGELSSKNDQLNSAEFQYSQSNDRPWAPPIPPVPEMNGPSWE